ncbi:anthranilate synthase component I family protein [Acinetobacter lanii]|uniref:Anthranilate synthase component I family protein n=1 Tax=Acinetobacter lanii TaxID=2715163 RepID=A0A6G8S611_9GAMM|nr:anthranilate synthase component I family protein [Acinetobacter lanii]
MLDSEQNLSPHSHFLNSSFFKKNLKIGQLSPAQILQKLQHLKACIYLENHHQPVIAVLPKQFYLAQNNLVQVFSRQTHFEYEAESKHVDLLSFVQLAPEAVQDQQKCTHEFRGGYLGFIDYNFAASQQIESNLKPQPNLFIGRYESYLKLENDQWFFYSDESEAEDLYACISGALNQETQNSFALTQACTATWEKNQYQHAFKKVQDYIVAGDCYQINLTQTFAGQATGELIDTAQAFWSLTDAPYSGYLKLDDFELLSCSPELFIDFEPNRKLVTKPIKGTMPRFADPEQDESSKQTLADSEKDQAENVMIVDLLRNDLSVYAEIGSVKTPKLFNIESFNQVHHMVSEVEATLKADVNPFEVLLSALPGGSITGAPKIRAMQIIEELESAPRGAYCGSMGYFNFDGTGSWNILIRSIQKYQDDVSLWAGGGITIASDCDAEYQECFDKVEAMLDLLNTWYRPE